MNNIQQIPTKIQQALKRELKQGEKIKWLGGPIASSYALRGVPLTIVGSILTVFFIFWMGNAVDFKVPDFSDSFALFSLIFFLLGIPGLLLGIALIGSPVWLFTKAELIVYVITDQRAMILDGSLGGVRIRSFYPHHFEQDTIKVQRDGSGDLIFAEEGPQGQAEGNVVATLQSILQGPGFYAIANVRDVRRRLGPLLKAKKKSPGQLDDAVADTMNWKPLNTSSSSFDCYKLVIGRQEVLNYTTTLNIKVFCWAFMAAGIGLFLLGGPRQHGRWIPTSFTEEGLAQLMALLFFIAGASLLYFLSAPRLFDGEKKIFNKGRGKGAKSLSFAKIDALQLIPHKVYNSEGPDYINYQLNLVLKGGEREHVVDYHNKKNAHTDANIIAEFMRKKVFSPPD